MDRIKEYVAYHAESARVGDIDPSYEMLRYLCDRFELSQEQRYWLAFVYGLTYCGASTFYIYNEFPDYENLDSGRLNRWWAAHRDDIICQTDRRWIRSSNQMVPAIESYRKWIGHRTQAEHFATVLGDATTPEERYARLYLEALSLYAFGQFSLFLYTEALNVVTALDLLPTELDLDVAHSCRNGLCYAYGYDQWLTESEARTPPDGREAIQSAWKDVRRRLSIGVKPKPTVWAIETTLCAYKKYKRGKRYIGYYLDRQAVEIAKMAANVTDGVAWDVLWQYRAETYEAGYLAEREERSLANGFTDRMKGRGHKRTSLLVEDAGEWMLT